jgi:hypothetical protein
MSNVEATTLTRERPLEEALLRAEEALEAAEADYDAASYECAESEVQYAAMMAAKEAVDAARLALRESDEERDWLLIEEGEEYGTVAAYSAAEALVEARSNVDRANYREDGGTLWIAIEVRCELTGEAASETVDCEPDEPDCERGSTAHDWQSPYEIVGGIRENPGVWGSGGGVIIHEVCVICGCGRTTDTWAQNPANGEQGLTSVSYEVGEYADEVERLRALSEVAGAGCDRAQAAAAEILAVCRDDHRVVEAEDQDRARVDEVLDFLRRVRAATYGVRPLRLALHRAASTAEEARVARAVVRALEA